MIHLRNTGAKLVPSTVIVFDNGDPLPYRGPEYVETTLHTALAFVIDANGYTGGTSGIDQHSFIYEI